MSAHTKSTKNGDKRAESSETLPVVFANLFHHGIERVAHTQKMTLDILAQQSTEALNAWKRSMPSSTPGIFILDLAVESVKRTVDTQKSIVDLVAQQSALVVDMTKEGEKYINSVADMVHQTSDRTIAVQKAALDSATEQSKSFVETMKKRTGGLTAPAAIAADTFQRGMEIAIETQKQLVDLATKPLNGAAKA